MPDEDQWNKIKILTDRSNCTLGSPDSPIYSAVAYVQVIGEPIRISKTEFFSEGFEFNESDIHKECAKSLKKKLLELADSID